MKVEGMSLFRFLRGMNLFKGLVFIIGFILAFQAYQTSARAASTGMIYGFVYDANEIPLRSATMLLTGPDGYSESTTSTEVDIMNSMDLQQVIIPFLPKSPGISLRR